MVAGNVLSVPGTLLCIAAIMNKEPSNLLIITRSTLTKEKSTMLARMFDKGDYIPALRIALCYSEYIT